MLTLQASDLAPVVTEVLNAAYRRGDWPSVWKKEFASIIPKKPTPQSFSECRNISCTPVLSKLMEFFILEKLKEETELRYNQYGGIANCGANHYLIDTWNEILESMDEEGAACSLVSVDFAKAFNSMGH